MLAPHSPRAIELADRLKYPTVRKYGKMTDDFAAVLKKAQADNLKLIEASLTAERIATLQAVLSMKLRTPPEKELGPEGLIPYCRTMDDFGDRIQKAIDKLAKGGA